MIGNLVLGLFTLIIQLIITIYYTDKLPIIITFLSFLSLLAYFSISIYSLTRIMKLTLTTRKLESAEEYNNTLRILHDNVRAFKHDFDNIYDFLWRKKPQRKSENKEPADTVAKHVNDDILEREPVVPVE